MVPATLVAQMFVGFTGTGVAVTHSSFAGGGGQAVTEISNGVVWGDGQVETVKKYVTPAVRLTPPTEGFPEELVLEATQLTPPALGHPFVTNSPTQVAVLESEILTHWSTAGV